MDHYSLWTCFFFFKLYSEFLTNNNFCLIIIIIKKKKKKKGRKRTREKCDENGNKIIKFISISTPIANIFKLYFENSRERFRRRILYMLLFFFKLDPPTKRLFRFFLLILLFNQFISKIKKLINKISDKRSERMVK